MCCKSCSENQRKISVIAFGTFFVIFGLTTVVAWPYLANVYVRNSLILKVGSEAYKNWVKTPIPIYMEFYLFNWTNPDDIHNPNVKPAFKQMGPYVFLEKHFKENITFYENDTVSYYERRTWHFDQARSNGTLDDLVTAGHVITATVAENMRHQGKYTKAIINFILNHKGGKLYVTKPAREWIFDGYQDELLDFLRLFKTSKIQIPFERFGWLVGRNNSAEYNGRFTIHTGAADLSKLGLLTRWNGKMETGSFKMPCGTVNGSTGDLFPPKTSSKSDPDPTITIFANEACRFMNLRPNGTIERHDLTAVRWVGTDETLNYGKDLPNQRCFCDARREECPKAGVFSCKKCRNYAPIYASFPHFYYADSSYVTAIEGLAPDASKHEFSISVEPNTGIPLQVRGRIQINMMIEPDDDFQIYRGLPKFLMPMFWIDQRAELTPELAASAKMALNLSSYGVYCGIALICFGSVFLITAFALTISKRWIRVPQDDEDMLIN